MCPRVPNASAICPVGRSLRFTIENTPSIALNLGAYEEWKAALLQQNPQKLERKKNLQMARDETEQSRQTSGKSLQSFDKVVGAVVWASSTSDTEVAKCIH